MWKGEVPVFNVVISISLLEMFPYEFINCKCSYLWELTLTEAFIKNLIRVNARRVSTVLALRDFSVFSTIVEKCNPSTTQPTRPNPSTTTGKSKGHVVAIAVGCSLAALVIIVGVGYMIGRRRRRNQAAGYRKLWVCSNHRQMEEEWTTMILAAREK